MAYSNQHNNNRPFELASKASHSQIINSSTVKQYLNHCRAIGSQPSTDNLGPHIHPLSQSHSGIDYVVAVDSGSTVPLPNKDATGKLSVVQFGVLLLAVQDFLDLRGKPIIESKDLGDIKRDRGCTLILPTAGISYKNRADLADSLRLTIYEFFHENDLLDTWSWLVWQKYRKPPLSYTNVVNFRRKCPKHPRQVVKFSPGDLMQKCPNRGCSRDIYTTDIFNLQSLANEDEMPAKFARNLIQLIETVCLVRAIKIWVGADRPIDRALFVIDGQLMVSDPTRSDWGDRNKLTRAFRHFSKYMMKHHNLNLIGVEKSGPFVNYANRITSHKQTKPLIGPGCYLMLNEDVIRQEIIPRSTGKSKPYGYYEHYGSKIIFRTKSGRVHVLTTPPWSAEPQPTDFPNLESILVTIDNLRCDLYDNALIPITMANNAFSLSFRPGKDLLARFIADNVASAPKLVGTKKCGARRVIQSPIKGLARS